MLVFTRTKHGADKVVKDLVKLNMTAQAIHGNKSQNARQLALSNFKSRITRVLVATDIAARGIDIDELTHVINYEIPNIPETYVHRIGRTGRAGNSGVAWSFVDREEVPFLRDIQKLIKQDIPVVTEHPFLPGTHVAEANDAKPFYNDGNNGNQRVARKREPSQGREIGRTCSEGFELLSTGAERSPRSTSQRRPQAKAQDRRSAEALYALQTPRLTYFLDSNKSIGIISNAALIVN